MDTSQEPSQLSTQPYRGTRDFFPELQRLRTRLFGSWRKVLSTYGFEEYDAPLLEPLELYAAKSSEEIVSTQLYSFVDRGDRRVALRPEMTPTLARMVASRSKQLSRPIRWYSIPRCMRYERPQRGRLREFDQLNVDIFGGIPFDEDLEILMICADILTDLGAPKQSFEIKINDRRLMNDLLTTGAKLKPECVKRALGLIDRREKLPQAEVLKAWQGLYSDVSGAQAEKQELNPSPTQNSQTSEEIRFFEILDSVTASHDFDALETLLSAEGKKVLSETLLLQSGLQKLFPDVTCVLDLSIARGFDYYTGVVFEIFDTHPDNRRALFGGGRYDNLIGTFVDDKLPGVGFGVSDVSLLNFCEVHQISLETGPAIDAAVVRFAQEDRLPSLELAKLLRQAGVRCTSPLTDQKFGKQIQSAQKAGARAIVFRGQDEFVSQTFSVKWLETGSQESFAMTPEAIAQFALRVIPKNEITSLARPQP